ncbi:MAG: POTRA domain-containing protein [Nitrospinales bacterium]
MRPQKRKLILFVGVLAGIAGLAGVEDTAARQREPSYEVKKVRVEKNILFDDRTLAPVVDLRGGMKMTPGIMELLVAEVEGFYSSHGHFLVRAEIPQKKPRRGVLKLQVNETDDILAGNGERERAKREVEKLIRSARLKIDEARKNEVIEQLARGYRTLRLAKAAARQAAEQAKSSVKQPGAEARGE